MAGLWTRPSVARVAATSASLVSRPYCAAITSYPSACSGPVSLFQHEPSAQIPWQNTMLGLVGVDMDSSSIVLGDGPIRGAAQTPAWPDGQRRSLMRSGEARHNGRQRLGF